MAPEVRPLVSVVIPVHNGETTLAATLASVFAQTLEDFEVLVVDDASTDATPALLQALAAQHGPRLRHGRLARNQGSAAARNAAFARARADCVAPIDADDLWSPDKLQRQLEALAERPEAVAVYSWTAHVDGAGRYLNPGAQAVHEGDVFHQLLLGNFLESGSNPLVRASAWRAVGGYDATLLSAEDWDFYLRLAAHGPFAVVPATQVYYRKHERSTSAKNLLQIEGCARRVVDRHCPGTTGPLGQIRRATLGNLYKYFLQLVYEGPPAAWRGPTGVRCVVEVLRRDPRLFRRPGLVTVLLLKAMIRLLPASLASTVESGLARLPGLRHLPGVHRMPMGTLQTELPEELKAAPRER